MIRIDIKLPMSMGREHIINLFKSEWMSGFGNLGFRSHVCCNLRVLRDDNSVRREYSTLVVSFSGSAS